MAAVSDGVRTQLERAGMLDLIGHENVLAEDDLFLAALRRAYDVAQAWLEETGAN